MPLRNEWIRKTAVDYLAAGAAIWAVMVAVGVADKTLEVFGIDVDPNSYIFSSLFAAVLGCSSVAVIFGSRWRPGGG